MLIYEARVYREVLEYSRSGVTAHVFVPLPRSWLILPVLPIFRTVLLILRRLPLSLLLAPGI